MSSVPLFTFLKKQPTKTRPITIPYSSLSRYIEHPYKNTMFAKFVFYTFSNTFNWILNFYFMFSKVWWDRLCDPLTLMTGKIKELQAVPRFLSNCVHAQLMLVCTQLLYTTVGWFMLRFQSLSKITKLTFVDKQPLAMRLKGYQNTLPKVFWFPAIEDNSTLNVLNETITFI